MMTITSIGNKDNEGYKAFRYFEKLGIYFETSPRHRITFTIGDESTVFSPIFYMFTNDDLIDLSIRIKSLGFFGRKVIKTMVKVINELDDEEKVDLLNNFYCRSFSGEEIVKHFMKTLRIHIHKANVKIGDSITKKGMRNIYFSFGKSDGVYELFKLILRKEIEFFRKARTAEEELGYASIISIPNVHLNPCTTCKNCKIDSHTGMKICKGGYVDIPENMTVAEVNEKYPYADMFGGVLQSRYILHNFDHCDYYRSRIGAPVIHSVKNCVRETI